MTDGRAYEVESLRDQQADFRERYSGMMPRLLARLGATALTSVYSALPATAPEFDQ